MADQKESFPHWSLFNKVKVVAGDIAAGDYTFDGSNLVHDTKQRLTHPNPTATISLTAPGISQITPQTDESIKNLPEAVAWGIAAGAIFGPLGIVAGLMFGGWGVSTCSLVEFKDGKKFLIVTTEKIMHEIQALASLKQ